MTGARVALEQFAPAPAFTAPDLGLGLDLNPPGSEFVSPDPTELDLDDAGFGDGPANDLGKREPMGKPLIRPAPMSEPDPDAEELAALQNDLSDACQRLAQVIAAIEAEQEAAKNAAAGEMAGRIAAIGQEVIQSIVNGGFVAEVAAAIADIGSRIPHSSAQIHVATEDHDALVNAIAAHAPETEITLLSDSTLMAGQAQMTWPDGGADFDAAALAAEADTLIAERLADVANKRN